LPGRKNSCICSHTIVFLASDESQFTLGADILIDGGLSL
jgi:hypothetical protein